MTHGIEGCTQVEKNKDVKGTRVSRGEEDIEESSFCAVEGARNRLERFKLVIDKKMGL